MPPMFKHPNPCSHCSGQPLVKLHALIEGQSGCTSIEPFFVPRPKSTQNTYCIVCLELASVVQRQDSTSAIKIC